MRWVERSAIVAIPTAWIGLCVLAAWVVGGGYVTPTYEVRVGGAIGGSAAIGGGTSSSGGCSAAAAAAGSCTGPQETPTFDFNPGAGSGVGFLTAVGFGSTTLTTVVLCDARTDTGTSWPCTTGGTFVENPSGVTAGDPAPFTDVDARASIYAGSVAHEAPDLTTGDIATEDFVAEWVGRTQSRTAVQHLVGKLNSGGSLGWDIGVDATDHLTATVNGTTITSSDTLDAFGEWDIMALYCKHDGSSGSMRLYRNGYSIATGVCPAATSSSPTKHLTFAAQPDNAGAQSMIGRISNVRVSKCTACMTTTAAMDAEAQKHAQEIMGVWPTIGVTKPPLSTGLRDTVASLDIDRDGDGIARTFRVGKKWLRVGRRCDTTRGNMFGGCDYYTGYLSEQTVSNLLLRSTDFSTTWTLLNGADNIQTQRYVVPDGSTDGDRLRGAADAIGTEHGVRQTSPTLTAARYTFSVWTVLDLSSATVKPYAWLRDNTVANTATWFDTRACTVAGTVGTGLYANTDPPMFGTTATRRSARATFWGVVGSGTQVVCRFEIDVLGTVATHDFDVGFSNADGTLTSTIAGANEAIGGLWGGQLELSVIGHRATTPIYTAGATVQRDGDTLEFAGANIPATGMLAWSVFLPNSLQGSSLQADYICVPFVDANNNMVVKTTQSLGNGARGPSYTSTAGRGFYAEIKTAGVEQMNCCGNGAGFGQYFAPANNNGYDGREHHVRFVYKTNDARGYLDGDPVFGVGDQTVDLPDWSTGHLDIGVKSDSNTNHPDGLIRRCRLFSAEVVVTSP